MKKSLINILKCFLGILIISVLFYKIGFSEIYNVIKKANFHILIITPVIYIFAIFIGSLNLKILFKPLKDISAVEFFKYFWLSSSIGLLFPGKVGNFSILYFLKQKGISIGEGASLLVLDKIVTSIISSFFAFFAFFIFVGRLKSVQFMIVLIVLFFIGIFILFSRTSRNIIKKYILRKYSIIFRGFSKTFFEYLKHHKFLIFINSTLTIIKYIFMGICVYLIFLSLNENVFLWHVLFIGGAEFIVSLIPITISGLGTRESIGIFLYHNLGVAYPIIMSRYVIGLTLRYSIGALSFFVAGKNLERIKSSLK